MQHPCAGSGFSRRTLAVAGGALGGAVLAACGGPVPGGSQPAGGAPKPVTFPETLYVTTINNFTTNDPAFLASVDEFMKQRNVKLELTPGSNQEVITRIAGGTPPDVFRRDAAAFHQLVSEGGARDLQPFFQAAKDVKLSDYYPHLLKGQTFQGKLVAVPEDFQPASVLYYNKSLLGKAGEAAPSPDMAWPQFLELCRRLTKGGAEVADQYGYAFPKWTYEQFVYNAGGQTVDSVESPTKCLLDSAQALQGLEFMVDLQHKYKVMPAPQVMTQAGLASENNWFLAGRLVTLNSGTWTTGVWNQSKENLDWGMTLAPKGQDGKWHYATGGAGWAIPAAAKNPDASWEWLRWQFGTAGWRVWLSKRDPKTFWLPALRALAEEDAKRLETIYPNASQVVKSADYIWFRPGGARWEKANTEIVGPAIASLHENKAPVRATIQDAVQRANAVLAGN